MNRVQQGRSGRTFFLIALFVILSAIFIPLLMANDQRNLRRIQTYFGLPATGLRMDWWSVSDRPAPMRQALRKTARLPGATIPLPLYTFADLRGTPQHLRRFIQTDPRDLCRRIAEAGFPDLQMKSGTGPGTAGNWECSSFKQLGTQQRTDETSPSSVFILVKGDDEHHALSFRVKINIEKPSDRIPTAEMGSNAASVFLTTVRWDRQGDIVDKIRKLEEFDLRAFGSRIQMKREFGETPRYNFTASQMARTDDPTPIPDFFERGRWFPVSDQLQVPMIHGMVAGLTGKALLLPQPLPATGSDDTISESARPPSGL